MNPENQAYYLWLKEKEKQIKEKHGLKEIIELKYSRITQFEKNGNKTTIIEQPTRQPFNLQDTN